MKNFSISKKLTVTFILVIALFLATVVTTLISITKMSQDLTTYHDRSFVASTESAHIRRSLQELEKLIVSSLVADTQEQ